MTSCSTMSWLKEILENSIESSQNKSSSHDIAVPSDLDRDAFYQDRSLYDWKARVRIMWLPNDHGTYSPELEIVKSTTGFSAIAGALVGIVVNASNTRKEFMRKNRHELFTSPMEAERKLYERMLLTSYKYGWKWGWRSAAMTFLFTGGKGYPRQIRS